MTKVQTLIELWKQRPRRVINPRLDDGDAAFAESVLAVLREAMPEIVTNHELAIGAAGQDRPVPLPTVPLPEVAIVPEPPPTPEIVAPVDDARDALSALRRARAAKAAKRLAKQQAQSEPPQ